MIPTRAKVPPWRLPDAPIDARTRVFGSPLPDGIQNFLHLNDVAYFVYVGRTAQTYTPKFVYGQVRTAGAGAQTAEFGLFSTPGPPAKAALTFTKIQATGTIGSLTGAGAVRNTAAFTTVVPSGTHLWAGMRTAMASTQPTMVGLIYDQGVGFVQSTATAGALTGTGPWVGSIPAVGLVAIAPALRVELD